MRSRPILLFFLSFRYIQILKRVTRYKFCCSRDLRHPKFQLNNIVFDFIQVDDNVNQRIDDNYVDDNYVLACCQVWTTRQYYQVKMFNLILIVIYFLALFYVIDMDYPYPYLKSFSILHNLVFKDQSSNILWEDARTEIGRFEKL